MSVARLVNLLLQFFRSAAFARYPKVEAHCLPHFSYRIFNLSVESMLNGRAAFSPRQRELGSSGSVGKEFLDPSVGIREFVIYWHSDSQHWITRDHL